MKSEKKHTHIKKEFHRGWVPGIIAAVVGFILISCAEFLGGSKSGGGEVQAAPAADTTTRVYRAELSSLNESIAGMSAGGTATITVRGDSMFIEVVASGLQPGIMHLQHYHGFPGGEEASCATMDQDVNGDGVLDLIETREVSGVTLVPFNQDPSELELTAETYPEAGEQGTINYRDTVIVSELLSALKEKYGIDSLSLEDRVVYLHGVSPDTQLPETVESLEGVPAHVTLPVACGRLEEVDEGWFPF